MKRLARIFSVFVIVFLAGAIWLVLRPDLNRVGRLPRDGASDPGLTRPDQTAPPTAGNNNPDGSHGLERLPGLPKITLPDWKLPDIFSPPAPPPEVHLTSSVDRILIEKAARKMTVYQKEGPEKTYRIALGRTPVGTKDRQGDGRTPEGRFRIDRLNDKSRFHLSLGLDYPQKQHREAARRAGVNPGGDIMIHGQPNEIARGYRVKGDWTEGCIAVDDHEIEELFAHTKIGTIVDILP